MTDQEKREELAQVEAGAVEEKPVAPEVGAGGPEAVAKPEAAPIAEPEKVDLTERPEFREWQAGRDREMAALQSRLTALQQDNVGLRRQQYELATAGMDESERAGYENRVLRSQMDQMRQQQQRAQQAGRMEQFVTQTLEGTGLSKEEVPPGEYGSPELWLQAVAKKAADKAKAETLAEIRRQEKKVQARKAATHVDTGSAAPAGGELADLKQQMQDLRGSGRVAEALALRRRMAQLEG